MATVEILSIPLGSQLTSTIGTNDPDDLNDFPVLLIFSENVNLTQSGVSVSAGSNIVAFEGKNSVYKATIRPPQTAGTVTVTVAANAVSQGNPQTTQDIRVSTRFPDVDAEVPTSLFAHGLGVASGIAATATRILITQRTGVYPSYQYFLEKFTYSGTHLSSEQERIPEHMTSRIDFINGDFIVNRYRFGKVNGNFTLIHTFASHHISAHSSLGFIGYEKTGRFYVIPYGETNIETIDIGLAVTGNHYFIANQNEHIYLYDNDYRVKLHYFESDTTQVAINQIRALNVNLPANVIDFSLYIDTLYVLQRTSIVKDVYTLDIRKYRAIAKNTKTTIYPIFAEAGDTIDLKQFSPDAERIVFDIGYDKQPNLSINASNELVVGSGAKTCLVKLKAINRIDATETDSFQFYLIVRQATAPVWRNVLALTMRAGSSYDLFQLVPDADTISFRIGRTRLAGSRLSNGTFTIGTVGGVSHFTAQKGGRSAHIAITIDVIQGFGVGGNPSPNSEVVGYRIEIAGRDVTSDSVAFPSVSETLDPVVINEYRVNEASITLRNSDGKYSNEITDNFWETHGLNAGGFQNAVKIYLKYLDGSENLHFSGVINESFVPIKSATIKLNCSDISSRLRKALVQSFGTLEKWDALRKQSDEDSYVGVYVPDPALGQMQVGTGIARSDRTGLAISRLALPSEGVAPENTGYMTPTEFRTAGGFLEENPLLRFKGEHLSEDVRFLIHQLAINKEVYNTEIDIPGVEVKDPFLLNRGSIAFSVEPTRTTRLPVDWVQGVESGLQTPPTVLILLSNPEGHISDLLVQYNVEADSYRVLHTFDKDVSVHRITRRNATNYYILTSGKITQNRSARELPRPNDKTGYGYDSVAEGSAIQIYHYNSSTGTLTEHVAEDDNLPPQLGIHYWIGFENDLYIDEFEGIRPDYRGPFKWYSNNLYYRYAKDGEFGVARADTGGTTTKMIGQAVGGYQNHLNFAFDINSSGTIYFAYMTGDKNTSTLVIKRRTSNGTETTVLSETRGIGDFNELGFDFGAFLGCYEALFHNNQLYMLCPIQKVDFGDGIRSVINPDVTIEKRSAEKSGSAERNVTSATVNPGNLTLAPGADIPVRIYFDGRITGATQSDLTVYGGTIQSFTVTNLTGWQLNIDVIDVTIRPNSQTHHKNIVIDVAEDAVDQGNEAWRIVISFDTHRSRRKTAGMVLYRCDVMSATPSLTVVDKWDFVTHSACGLVVHDNSIHYIEHPRAAAAFKPINPDL